MALRHPIVIRHFPAITRIWLAAEIGALNVRTNTVSCRSQTGRLLAVLSLVKLGLLTKRPDTNRRASSGASLDPLRPPHDESILDAK